MSSREAFEAWCETILKDNPNWRESGDAELGWQAWQAATFAALERAAVVCDEIKSDYTYKYVAARAKAPNNLDYLDGASDGAEECADAIRVLKDDDE